MLNCHKLQNLTLEGKTAIFHNTLRFLIIMFNFSERHQENNVPKIYSTLVST